MTALRNFRPLLSSDQTLAVLRDRSILHQGACHLFPREGRFAIIVEVATFEIKEGIERERIVELFEEDTKIW